MTFLKRLSNLCCVGLTLFSLSGCSLAPQYFRPAAPVPGNWPEGTAYQETKAAPQEKTVADIAWQDFYQDVKLQHLMRLALDNNRNLRIAALNIERMQAQYRIQRAALVPEINGVGSSNNQAAAGKQYSASVGFSSYELDIFGRIQSLRDQFLDQFLATEQAKKAVQVSLLGEVAADYLALAADRERLALAMETLKAQQETLQLISRRFEVGASSELDLRQAEAQVETARLDVARYTTLIAQDENALNLALGTIAPSELLPRTLSDSLTALSDITPELPSAALLKRPDILQAENLLKGYNANIGAARAAFFPRITLSTTFGSTNDELSDLFKSGVWTFLPQVSIPIFDTGLRSAQLQVAKTDRDIAVAQYEKAIQTAFREVADALAQRGTIDEQLSAQLALVAATDKRLKLSQARYERGIDNYLNVLDAQRSLYTAQQGLITIRLTRLANLIMLYKVLGGGREES